MSQVAISGNASGTGTLTIAAPNTNSNYTLTLPAATSTLVGTDATQTLTNKTIQGGAITSGTAVSASGTSVNFTDIPSWVKRITVMFSGVSTNGSGNYQIQIGSGSVTTSGYLGSTGYFTSGTAVAAATAGFIIYSPSGAAVVAHGISTLVLVNAATNTWAASSVMASSQAAQMLFGAGSISLAGALDRVRVTTSTGTDTFDAGTINILYEG